MLFLMIHTEWIAAHLTQFHYSVHCHCNNSLFFTCRIIKIRKISTNKTQYAIECLLGSNILFIIFTYTLLAKKHLTIIFHNFYGES